MTGTEQDFHWLVGILEGEGSFLKGPPSAPNQPRISISMTDADVIQRVADLFGITYCHSRLDLRNPNWKCAFVAKIAGLPAVTIMKKLQPFMGARRQAQIQKAIDSYDPNYRADRYNAPKLSAETAQRLKDELAPFTGRLPHGKLKELAETYNLSKRNVHKIRFGETWTS